MDEPVTIPKLPVARDISLDYVALRQMAINAIEQLGSGFWTDYNIHDPGITITEAVIYAITELAYRANFSIPDLIADPPGVAADPDRQGFFTALTILTVNPWTTTDFRKLLVDVLGVKNAWLICKTCPCDFLIYADCAKSSLVYTKTEHPITIRGFYDVLIEFDTEAAGDLNSGKVEYNFVYPIDVANTATATIEMRFPSYHTLEEKSAAYHSFRSPNSSVTLVTVEFISGNPADAVDIPDAQLPQALRAPLFATIKVDFHPDANLPATDSLTFSAVPFTVWFSSDAARGALKLAQLREAMSDASPGGLVTRYQSLIHTADQAMGRAKSALQAHRNLCEDFCSVAAVEVEDVGICADLIVRPDVNIETLLAEAYYRISQALAPDIRFYALSDLQSIGVPADQIFNGPALNRGFIKDDELAAAQLKHTLYASDIIAILMDLDGVQAVENFTFVGYDANGARVAAYSWSIDIPDNRQPRFYVRGSKLLIFKQGLPFLPDPDELADAMRIIEGERARAAFTQTENDLAIPKGRYTNLTDYFPVQYSLPQTYGVGFDGLPTTASSERKGKAKQLQAYMLFFEQLLLNFLTQLQHCKDLFAIDDTVAQSYFASIIDDGIIRGVQGTLYDGLTAPVLASLVEDAITFADRRNRFLNALLARFAEDLSQYALMLYTFESGKAIADAELIKNKIAFLKNIPFISSNRGRSFNIKDPAHVCTADNVTGLQRRIERLLGLDPAKDKLLIVEHLLLRPRNAPGAAFPDGDPLLPICIAPDCSLCGEEDPYSFRLTVVLDGETGIANQSIPFRRFAENTIRLEVPAHIGVKACWVAAKSFESFRTTYCAWLGELAKPEPDPATLHTLLVAVIQAFTNLKSVYPPATLHDCHTGSQGYEVFLGQTII